MSIAVLPGDGIGQEIMPPALELLDAVGTFEITEYPFGGASIDAHGVPLTDEVLNACRESEAVLLGAVGGPKWSTPDPDAPRPEQGLLALRQGLGLYANLRLIRPLPALYATSPLQRERIERVNLIVVRELTGGIYFGEKTRSPKRASDLCVYTEEEIERIARVAFQIAQPISAKVTSIDKANVLATSQLWREVVSELQAREFPSVELEHMYVDNAAMQLMANPRQFEVVVTENMFGDILSDEAAMLTGSIGLIPSISLGDDGPGLFEPIHGSAPDIAGKGVANPLAMFMSVAVMLKSGLDREREGIAIETAVNRALEAGLRTPDLGGTATTTEATQAVLQHIK
jgi:3-isopropylmalate dehydrogenase